MQTVQTIWCLFDLDNNRPGSHNYVWWFESREQARKFKREHVKLKHHARLSAPIRFEKPKLDKVYPYLYV